MDRNPVTRHDLAALDHAPLTRSSGDQLFHGFTRKDHEISLAAFSHAIALKFEDFGTLHGAGIERETDFVMTAKIIAQPDKHRALQHVAIAIGAPGIANTVRPGADANTRRQ